MRDNRGNNNTNYINEGGQKFNGNNNGNIVYGTQIINNPSNISDKIEYNLEKGKVGINHKAFSILGGSLSIAGIISLIADVCSIIESFGKGQIFKLRTTSYFTLIAAILGFVLLCFVSEIKRKKIVSIFPGSIFRFNIGLFKDGKIGRIKLTSKCPKEKCGGKLWLYYDNKKDKFYFLCSRNPSQHKFEFDFTSLDY